jgi:DNA polymerase-3 subunit alpha
MKALNYTSKEADDVAKSVPEKMPDQTDPDLQLLKDIRNDPDKFKADYGDKLQTVVNKVNNFWNNMSKYPDVEEVLNKIEGIIISYGVHAGGVIITPPGKLKKNLPTKHFDSSQIPVSQFDMESVDTVKALKLDLLGLKTLSVIDVACKLSGINKEDLDIENYDDYPEVYQIIRDGYTKHVFQLSSPGMTKMCNDIDISSFAELTDALALYRPGPLGAIDDSTGLTMVESYIEAKKTNNIPSIHKDIDSILSISKGCLVYQEQLMSISQKIAGYSLGQADIKIRKPVGKKKPELLPPIRKQFINGDNEVPGAIAVGYQESFASNLWDMIVKFAGYGFNKSHSACYADLSWKTAYLKAHAPAAYMAAVMTVYHSNIDKVIECIVECKKMGIDIYPPSVNHSKPGFSIEKTPDGKSAIRYGLTAIKGVGISAAETLQQHRPYTSVKDFYDKIHNSKLKFFKEDGSKMNNPLSRRNEKVLIEAGAFDELEENRFKSLNEYMALRKDKKHQILMESSFDRKTKLSYEKEHIGTYISDHPLKNYPFMRWNDWEDGDKAELGGIIRKVEIKKNKKGNTFCTGTLETLEDKRRFIIHDKAYEKNKNKIKKDERVIMIGRKNSDYNNINVSEVKLPRFMRTKHQAPEENVEVDIELFGGETIGFEQ